MKGDRIIFGEHGKPNRYYLDGQEVTSEQFYEAHPPQEIRAGDDMLVAANWKHPVESDALAVHPKQIKEVMARNEKHGLNIGYRPDDGRPILENREQRRKLMKIEGCHDNNGGYGDG